MEEGNEIRCFLFCSVCQNTVVSLKEAESWSITSCGHPYHSHCLKPWLVASKQCPDCRQHVNRVTPVFSRSEPSRGILPATDGEISDPVELRLRLASLRADVKVAEERQRALCAQLDVSRGQGAAHEQEISRSHVLLARAASTEVHLRDELLTTQSRLHDVELRLSRTKRSLAEASEELKKRALSEAAATIAASATFPPLSDIKKIASILQQEGGTSSLGDCLCNACGAGAKVLHVLYEHCRKISAVRAADTERSLQLTLMQQELNDAQQQAGVSIMKPWARVRILIIPLFLSHIFCSVSAPKRVVFCIAWRRTTRMQVTCAAVSCSWKKSCKRRVFLRRNPSAVAQTRVYCTHRSYM